MRVSRLLAAAAIAGLPLAAQSQTVLSVQQEEVLRPLFQKCQKDFSKEATAEEQTACAQQLYRTLGGPYRTFDTATEKSKNPHVVAIAKEVNKFCHILFGAYAENNNQVLYAAELGMIAGKAPVPFSKERNEGYLGYVSAVHACDQAMGEVHDKHSDALRFNANDMIKLEAGYAWSYCSFYSLRKNTDPSAPAAIQSCNMDLEKIRVALGEHKPKP